MQLEDCGGRNDGALLGARTLQDGRREHADAEEVVWVLDLDADLGGAQAGVELGADVADDAGEGFAGEGVELDVGVLAKMDVGKIVLVDVADDPDVGEIGYGEGAGGARVGDACGAGGGYVLRGNDAGGAGVNLD